MPPQTIVTSVHNPIVKRVRRLHETKGRREEGLFLLEGSRVVAEARRSSWEIAELYGTPAWLKDADPAGDPPPVAVADHVLAAMSTLATPEGVIALVRLPRSTRLPDIGPTSLWVACDRLQDPSNLGAIIRTADAAGVDALLLGPGTADPFGPKVVRASMGSVLHLPLVTVSDIAELRQVTRSAGMRWVAAVPRAGRQLYEVDLTGPLCWWLGNEAGGLAPEIAAMADLTVEIPMPGRAESLNAAAAAAVCVFETVRQRLSRRSPIA